MVLTTLLVDAARIQQHPDGNMEKELKRGNENYEDTCMYYTICSYLEIRHVVFVSCNRQPDL